MKKSLGIILLVIMIMLYCGCGAAKDGAAPEMAHLSLEDIEDNGSYSMERSAAFGRTEASQETPPAEQIQQEPLIYVTFSQHSDSVNADDGTKLFISQSYIPSFVSEDETVNHWISSAVDTAVLETAEELHSMEQQAWSDYQSRAGDESLDFYAYSYYSNVSSARLDNSVVSVLQVNSVYSGGTHPNYAQKAYNLDLVNCTELGLTDVILPGGAEFLHRQVLERLEDRFGGLEHSGLYADYPQIVTSYFEDPDLTPNWYFSENGLVIYFNCYDIAPYAAGIIKVEFPYDALTGVLKPEFYPETVMAGPGELIALDSADGRRVLGTSAEGECTIVGTEQTIYDVKLHRLAGWLTDDVPMTGQMVLAANRLTAEEALAIPLGEGFGYLVTYSSDGGLVRKMVFDSSGTQEIVDEIAE